MGVKWRDDGVLGWGCRMFGLPRKMLPVLGAIVLPVLGVVLGITATDDKGLSNTREFGLAITNVNDPPALKPLVDRSTREDQPLSLQVFAEDIDSPVDSMVYKAFTDIPDAISEFVFESDRLTITPEPDWNGQVTISVVVADGQLNALSDSQAFVLNVSPVNDPPVSTELDDITVNETINAKITIL